MLGTFAPGQTRTLATAWPVRPTGAGPAAFAGEEENGATKTRKVPTREAARAPLARCGITHSPTTEGVRGLGRVRRARFMLDPRARPGAQPNCRVTFGGSRCDSGTVPPLCTPQSTAAQSGTPVTPT